MGCSLAYVLVPLLQATRVEAADQFVELEDRLARGVMRRQGAQFPDQNALAHLFEPESGDHAIDVRLL